MIPVFILQSDHEALHFSEYRIREFGGGADYVIRPREIAEANARLIAAAPDLLKTLQETQQTLLGVSSYLATCDSATIIKNLDSLITSLRISLAIVATAIQRAKGESL